MDFLEFNKTLKGYLEETNLEVNNECATRLYKFMNLLIQENKKINLTSITSPREIILKHFFDSMIINYDISDNEQIIDIGTGAGFPGIPLAIYRKKVKIYLLDSLNKRIEFLKKIIEEDNIKNAETILGRAEEVSRTNEYREKFDTAVSRAVAPLNTLVEYMIPFIKVGGKCICMKGPNYIEELEDAKVAIAKLGGKVADIKHVQIENIERTIIIIKKIKKTEDKYPRKAGIPTKRPIK